MGFSGAWQPQITSASFDTAGKLALTGTGFRGISGASGGNGAQDSPTSYPLVQLRSLGSEQTLFLLSAPGANWSATSFTSAPVSGFPVGYALATVLVNGIPSPSVILDILLPVTSLADSGSGTLRAAIANVVSGGTITFTPGLPGTISLTSGELVIARDMNIIGPGATNLSISGNGLSRVFSIPSGVHASISGVTISNGWNVGATASAGQGGGILNHGSLSLSNCILRGNVAMGGAAAKGGAIFNGGDLFLYGCTFQTNAANGGDTGGGAIYSTGPVQAVNCTLWGNTATGG